jgi:hypothetical protein
VEIRRKVDSVEMVSDATEWLGLKHKSASKNKDQFELRFHDDEDQATGIRKKKLPSRISTYELAKHSVVSKLAEVFFHLPSLFFLMSCEGFWHQTTRNCYECCHKDKVILGRRSRHWSRSIRRTVCGSRPCESTACL